MIHGGPMFLGTPCVISELYIHSHSSSLRLEPWKPHSPTAGKEITHAHIHAFCVINNTKNIVSKTTLMKCQLSLGYPHPCWVICILQEFVWKHACCSLKYA